MSSRYIKMGMLVLGIIASIGVLLFFWQDSPVLAKSLSWHGIRQHAGIATSIEANSPGAMTHPATSTVPILVYHIVRPAYESDSQAVRSLAQTPEVFDAQMQYLADAGYTVIPFSDLENHIKTGVSLPRNPIVLTFDDGWGDQFTYALPILEKHHYTATFFIFTNPIGTRGFLTWDNVRALRDAGMTIGSHTRSHPFLTKETDEAKLWNEINGSKEKLQQELGTTINYFAYPFGKYNEATMAAVVKAGYLAARGDYVKKEGWQSTTNDLYSLSALNAPTTLERFKQRFPAK